MLCGFAACWFLQWFPPSSYARSPFGHSVLVNFRESWSKRLAEKASLFSGETRSHCTARNPTPTRRESAGAGLQTPEKRLPTVPARLSGKLARSFKAALERSGNDLGVSPVSKAGRRFLLLCAAMLAWFTRHRPTSWATGHGHQPDGRAETRPV